MKLKVSQPQLSFLQSQSKGTMYLGGVGTGKSFCLVLKSAILAMKGKRGLFLSYSLNNLRDNVVPLFRQILDSWGLIEYRDFKITKAPSINIIFLHNKAEILLRTASDPDSLRGPSVSFLMFEEARELSRAAFEIGIARLRAGNDLQWFIGSTTKGKNWFYEIIDENDMTAIFDKSLCPSGIISKPYLTVIRASTLDSPHLPDSYIEELVKQYSPTFAKQELEADIVITGAGIINPDWFKKLSTHKQSGKRVRSWDLAVTTRARSDYSVGALVSKDIDNKYTIEDINRVKLEYPDLKKLIIQTAIKDTNEVIIGVEESGQTKAIIDDLRRESTLAAFTIKTYRPTKDKVTRAYPFASQAELGNVNILVSGWNRLFYDECNTFGGDTKSHDDQIDAVTQGYYLLNTGGPVQVGSIG